MTKKMLFLLAMMLPLVASASHVTQEQAKSEALSFLQQKRGLPQSLQVATKAPRMASAPAGDALYYVFNVGNNGGFVIVSGDDRTNPILGFSDEGSFDPNNVPANMKSWLEGYSEQIKALDNMSEAQAKTLLAAPRLRSTVDTRNSIAPMITTKWDQATPYWNECPEFMSVENGDTIGELAYTGCVATAMSQIMNFHKYPTGSTSTIPAYSFSYNTGNYNYVSIDMPALEPTTFDWAHMKDSYTGAEDEIYTSAVAHLMFYVGCAIKSQYGTSATGAYTDDIPMGFGRFGYGSKLAYRNDYTQEVWDNMVYDELAAGRPMVYNGTAGSGGGHSFICDGYEYGNYFHINWGWSGMGNGYFQLAILNPSASGIGGSSSAEGYNMKQNIVYNIIPGGTAPADDPAEPALTVTAFSGPLGWDRSSVSEPFKIHKSKIVKVSYSDHAASGKKFKTALALLNPADSTFSLVENSADNIYMTVTTSALGYTHQFGSGIQSNASNVIKFGAGMTGTYHMVGVYQVEGTSEWKLMKESDRYYMEVNMTNYEASANYHPVISLQATNWEFTGGERVGLKEQVHVTLKNNSVDRFFGDLYLDFGGQQIDEYSQYTTVVTGEVLPGEENVITFNVTPTSSGTKTVKLMRLDAYGSYVTIASTTVNIGQSAEAEELNLSVVIQAENATTQPGGSNIYGEIYDSHARFSATITNHSNGEYNKYVLAPLFIVQKNPDGTVAGGSMVTYKQSTLSLAAGESKTLYFDFDNLAYGSTYAMNIYARNYVPDNQEGTHVENIVEPGHSVYYDILPGIITWTSEGVRNGYKPVEGFQVAADVAAVSLESLTLNSIVTNENPNTLYFIDEGATAPASLNGCNIVAGATAQSIVLMDGYPYFTPMSFTAQAISYERTFDKARQDGVAENWSTIVLPFTPATCSAASNNMWIERFAQEEDGVVKFDEVDGIEANVPYIIAINKAANLTGTPITWSASNVQMKPEPIANTSGSVYLMAGTFVGETVADAYAVDTAGAVAEWGNAIVEPFRAYFKELAELEEHADILLPGEATTGEVIPGDANDDGNVDVNDVTTVINYILGKNPNPFNYDNANVNGDTKVDVMDVTLIINLILGIQG